ncbi:histidine phosphatase family protein [Zavarzinia sp. CC-PAN008]|uniref:histidine phosphatase family protein n=1 Tax=Zavarzinia sp. CC-PAN008 TaxID=3243332 RepID=UPI003F74987E
MTRFAILRHGITAWNLEHRIQGRTDIPLCDAGRAALAGLTVPPPWPTARWLSSPMGRAVETANLLGARDLAIEPRLIETYWAGFEGKLLAEITPEGTGLHARAPGGESPADVQARLRLLLADLARDGRPAIAVAHKGVVRALLSLATGWDMTVKAPVRLDWRCLHVFALAADGAPALVQANVPLVAA